MNSNFFYSPIGYDHTMVWESLRELNARHIRFPGGWEANHYDWETGAIQPREGERIPRRVPFDDFMALAKKNRVSVVLVVNMWDPVEKTARLAKRIVQQGYDVAGVELGNEVYAHSPFSSGDGVEAYYRKCRAIAAGLKDAGLAVPVSVVVAPQFVPGKEKNRSFREWNETLSAMDLSFAAAVSYHYYLSLPELGDMDTIYRVSVRGLRDSADGLMQLFPGKSIWLTEWNLGMDPKSPYHNTTYHALLVARMYAAILGDPRIALANYHVLTGIVWELVGPDMRFFQYGPNMDDNDARYREKPAPSLHTVPYFALTMINTGLAAMSFDVDTVKFAALDPAAPLPVDVVVAADGSRGLTIAINPNQQPLPVATVPSLSIAGPKRQGVVLAGGLEDTNGSFIHWQRGDRRAGEVIRPRRETLAEIPGTALVVFSE